MTEPEFSDPYASVEPDANLDREANLDPDPGLDPDRRDAEAPAEDAYEQSVPADPAERPIETQIDADRDPEVNEWDALEQAHVVGPDDDYR